eukprot:CAMPEP_0182824782 /NCGR_PEP_ID=MMETSP0006_2-20121128/15478_1 /TAXON_ID=97485 /ORGANISM="Prymnesium parvum, Strain Texoma1" /LENGTH=44 /DNA_ID= /DNA_START= /DNA_END= /DNA_ORIENTATION=
MAMDLWRDDDVRLKPKKLSRHDQSVNEEWPLRPVQGDILAAPVI